MEGSSEEDLERTLVFKDGPATAFQETAAIWCRLVTASFNYFHSTNFFWMFGEGCYLHTAIVLTYSTDKLRKWMFICIGWCIPFPIIVAWAIGKLYYDNEKCWFGKRAGVYTDYIYQGPMILVLVQTLRPPAGLMLNDPADLADCQGTQRGNLQDLVISRLDCSNSLLAALPKSWQVQGWKIFYGSFCTRGPRKRMKKLMLKPKKQWHHHIQNGQYTGQGQVIGSWVVPVLRIRTPSVWFSTREFLRAFLFWRELNPQINFIFLFNIVRILMTKLRASTTSETIQYRKAVKATLVLLPLLGLTYMLFFVNPGEDEISQIVFIYFNSFLESFQGFFVSVFYCFLNSEVRSAVRKRFHRWQEQHSIRARMTQAMSIPTSPSRVSFHSIKQSSSL
ncbi:hypothetical protein NQZ68_025291 [Dissostichus eleginoides]|nr:hypothetical protein NQZ68_025291 [Dissostichus eleginoides]